jgi:hypothetical protein
MEEFGKNMASLGRMFSDPLVEKLALTCMMGSDNAFVADQARTLLKAATANIEVQQISSPCPLAGTEESNVIRNLPHGFVRFVLTVLSNGLN